MESAISLGSVCVARGMALNEQQTELSKQQYEMLRERLLVFFSRRSRAFADELADETLFRLTVRLSAEAEFPAEDIERYAVGIARNVWHENNRNPLHAAEPVEDSTTGEASPFVSSHDVAALSGLLEEAARRCAKKCLAKQLTVEERALILGYFKDDWHEQVKARKRLAGSLNLTDEGLRARAMRILKKLSTCAKKCLDGK